MNIQNSHVSSNSNINSADPLQPIQVLVSKSLSTEEMAKHIIEKYNEDGAFKILNLDSLKSQYEKWKLNFPMIHPYYAVKTNPNIRIVKALADLGANFDCASLNEIKSVLSVMNNPERIIFANPTKVPKHLSYAASVGVNKMTADSIQELEKCLLLHKDARILIRLKVDNSFSAIDLSSKFGASLEVAENMLNFAKMNNQNIVGVSFHVGCGCQSAEAYSLSMLRSLKVFEMGIALGHQMTILNIGGGFAGINYYYECAPIEDIASVVCNVIKTEFSHIENLEVISEPGRYFANATSSIIIPIIGKKVIEEQGQRIIYYFLEEGYYGAFHGLSLYPNERMNFQPLYPPSNLTEFKSFLFGPTVDPKDKLGEYMLPEMNIGDRIWIESYGAYDFSSNQLFNGFDDARNYQVIFENNC